MFNMAFSQGYSSCNAERHLLQRSYEDLIALVSKSMETESDGLKARLYDIWIDFSVTEEEKNNLSEPYNNELESLQERNIRAQRVVYIGLYSVIWEQGLLEICKQWKIEIKKAPNESPKMEDAATESKKKKSNKSQFDAKDYLFSICGKEYSGIQDFICNPLRELRNVFVHGWRQVEKGKENKQLAQIKRILPEYPHVELVMHSGECYFKSWNGLNFVLSLMCKELDEVEGIARAKYEANRSKQ